MHNLTTTSELLRDYRALAMSRPARCRSTACAPFWMKQCADSLELPEIWTDIAKWLLK